MAVLTSTGITFSDSTSQSTAATAAALVTTANVLSATAGASLGAVGTYGFFLDLVNSNTSLAPGATIAGSSLGYGCIAAEADGNKMFSSTGNPSGTWRLMGQGLRPTGSYTGKYLTVCLRIS
jgi:hypothetical protein